MTISSTPIPCGRRVFKCRWALCSRRWRSQPWSRLPAKYSLLLSGAEDLANWWKKRALITTLMRLSATPLFLTGLKANDYRGKDGSIRFIRAEVTLLASYAVGSFSLRLNHLLVSSAAAILYYSKSPPARHLSPLSFAGPPHLSERLGDLWSIHDHANSSQTDSPPSSSRS